ncbi:pseudouridine synthase [Fomitopsis serialis]|uniref:pseudouridine synthase n=1 Tax=Fomitopsis serialis TaxID=139415 RepID=UPI002008693C|nr:pseudouridine synthase [Neoantrodia serialis]KAH9926961.1 pseudouridine synthase [Neoantrodia serialis]
MSLSRSITARSSISPLCSWWQSRRSYGVLKLALFPRPHAMEASTKRTPSPGSSVKRPQASESDLSASKRPKLDVNETVTALDSPPSHALPESASGGFIEGQKSATERPDKQKSKKGQRGTKDRRRGTRREDAEPRDSEEPKTPRLPKRPCVLLLGFCGSGYSGMQFQPDQSVRTIEGVLFDALVRVGAVSQDNADNPTKVSLGRAARTDAGVHAAGNVVSLKLINAIPGVSDLVARINEELPPEIRLWSVLRTQNNFNARTSCDSRKYTYYFPSYMMIPPKPGTRPDADTDVDLRRKRDYRMPPDVLESLRATARKSCARYMKDISVADPVVYGDTEWVSVMFHGQSFMLHQRKMMSALVLACRTASPPDILDELYGPRMYPIFETYAKRIEKGNEKLNLLIQTIGHRYLRHSSGADGPVQGHAHLSSNARNEDEAGVFDAWIHLLWLNSKGIIPAAAVIHKGERRAGRFRERKHFDSTGYPTITDDSTTVVDEEAEEEDEALDKAKLDDMEG